MKILVTGATGKFGTKVMNFLLDKENAEDLAVSVRNTEKAQWLKDKGVDVRHGDFDQPDSLDKAFAGIDRLLIISTDGDNDTRIRQHKNAVEAAKRAGVGHIVYTSLANADQSQLFLAPVHRETEKAIQKTGIPYTFLRNNWYMENEISSIQAVLAGAPWVTAAGDGKVGWMLQRDYAEAAARVLSGAGHENKVYELSGALLTQADLAKALQEVIGKTVQVQQVDSKTYESIMREAGLPEFVVAMLVQIQEDVQKGTLEVDSNAIESLLGRPRTSVKEALAQLVNGLEK